MGPYPQYGSLEFEQMRQLNEQRKQEDAQRYQERWAPQQPQHQSSGVGDMLLAGAIGYALASSSNASPVPRLSYRTLDGVIEGVRAGDPRAIRILDFRQSCLTSRIGQRDRHPRWYWITTRRDQRERADLQRILAFRGEGAEVIDV